MMNKTQDKFFQFYLVNEQFNRKLKLNFGINELKENSFYKEKYFMEFDEINSSPPVVLKINIVSSNQLIIRTYDNYPVKLKLVNENATEKSDIHNSSVSHLWIDESKLIIKFGNLGLGKFNTFALKRVNIDEFIKEEKNFDKITINKHSLKAIKHCVKNIFSPKEMCTICLEKFQIRTTLNKCCHSFCKSCIERWATVSNNCPVCKTKFTKIIYYSPKCKRQIHKSVKDRTYNHHENEDSLICLDNCLRCGQSSEEYLLLVCDRCNYNVVHTFCEGFDGIPDSDWFCPTCVQDLN